MLEVASKPIPQSCVFLEMLIVGESMEFIKGKIHRMGVDDCTDKSELNLGKIILET